jgi:hypothetical protein
MVSLEELRQRAEAAGFRVERYVGSGIGYMALLRPTPTLIPNPSPIATGEGS